MSVKRGTSSFPYIAGALGIATVAGLIKGFSMKRRRWPRSHPVLFMQNTPRERNSSDSLEVITRRNERESQNIQSKHEQTLFLDGNKMFKQSYPTTNSAVHHPFLLIQNILWKLDSSDPLKVITQRVEGKSHDMDPKTIDIPFLENYALMHKACFIDPSVLISEGSLLKMGQGFFTLLDAYNTQDAHRAKPTWEMHFERGAVWLGPGFELLFCKNTAIEDQTFSIKLSYRGKPNAQERPREVIIVYDVYQDVSGNARLGKINKTLSSDNFIHSLHSILTDTEVANQSSIFKLRHIARSKQTNNPVYLIAS